MGTVANANPDLRSYLVSTPKGEYVRSRKHLQLLPNAETDCDVSKSKAETPTEPQTPQLPQTSKSVEMPAKTPIKYICGKYFLHCKLLETLHIHCIQFHILDHNF